MLKQDHRGGIIYAKFKKTKSESLFDFYFVPKK